MVHLNELHEKYKDQGLVVLGVTNEARSAVDGFVSKNDAAYPIVIESTDSIRAFQSNSFPTIVLIGPDGRVLSTANPSEQAIEAALENVRMLPEFPKSLAAVQKAMKKDKYGDALKKLGKVVDGGKLPDEEFETAREVLAWITWFGDSSFDGAVKDKAAGSVFMAYQTFAYLADAFKGHTLGTKAKAEVDGIMKDKGLKLEVKAGEHMLKIREEIAGAATAKQALKCLKPLLSKKYAETQAGKEAQAMATELEAKLDK